MAYQAGVTKQHVNVNGPLLTRCHIVDENNTDLAASDVSSVTLNIYKQVQNDFGAYVREYLTDWTNVDLEVSDVIILTVTSPQGKKYNFRYCIESAFEEPNTTYIVEYKIILANEHSILIVIQANTLS